MAHLHREYSKKTNKKKNQKTQLLWTLCWVYCSYNVMLFKESDCVFRYHIHIALGLGFPVTMNDKDSFLFNIQFTHCAHLCERAPLWDICKQGKRPRNDVLANYSKKVHLVRRWREMNSEGCLIKKLTSVWDGMVWKLICNLGPSELHFKRVSLTLI